MNLLLDGTTISWSILALIIGLSTFIYWFRYRIAKFGQTQQFAKEDTTIKARNKYQEVNVFKWSGTFLRIGMILSLAFVVLAFNYTTFEQQQFELGETILEEVIENDLPRTKDFPKPPPPPPPPVKIEIPDEPVEDTVAFVDQTLEIDEVVETPTPPQPIIEKPVETPPPPPDPVEANPLVIFAEQMPRFPGCQDFYGDKKAKDLCAQKKLLKFLSSKLKYPALARENGVGGTAVIRFVVEKDGSLSNMEIVRDPGAGLGKEALRVVSLMNKMDKKWSPGKQNARPVRVQFNLPIKFNLQ